MVLALQVTLNLYSPLEGTTFNQFKRAGPVGIYHQEGYQSSASVELVLVSNQSSDVSRQTFFFVIRRRQLREMRVQRDPVASAYKNSIFPAVSVETSAT